jgi:hypothetical protein
MKITKTETSLKQLSDIDTTGGSRIREDNIKHNQILMAHIIDDGRYQPKVFRFKNLSSVINAGSGITVTESNGEITISSTGGSYVPYTGATSNVDLGEYGLDAGFVSFDTTPTSTPTTQGTLSWDTDHSTLQLVLNGHVGQLMQDTFYYAKNQTGATIPAGTVVMANGTLGSSGRILITPFLADGTYPSEYVMGVTAESIANGSDGMVMHFGQLRGIDTSASSDGDILFASDTIAGGLQLSPPVAPNNYVLVAIVIKAAVNGILQIRPTIGSNINNDEGVLINAPTNKQVLTYDASTLLWKNQNPPIRNIITTTDGTAVTGTTSNTVTGSVLIPANTVQVGDVIEVRARVRKTGTAGLLTVRGYFNTSAAIGGANVSIVSNANTSLFSQFKRSLPVKSSTNTESWPIGSTFSDDSQTGTVAVSSNIDWTQNQYFIIAVTNTSAADSSRSSFIHVQINKP